VSTQTTALFRATNFFETAVFFLLISESLTLNSWRNLVCLELDLKKLKVEAGNTQEQYELLRRESLGFRDEF
jgi:hypothetical protein